MSVQIGRTQYNQIKWIAKKRKNTHHISYQQGNYLQWADWNITDSGIEQLILWHSWSWQSQLNRLIVRYSINRILNFHLLFHLLLHKAKRRQISVDVWLIHNPTQHSHNANTEPKEFVGLTSCHTWDTPLIPHWWSVVKYVITNSIKCGDR